VDEVRRLPASGPALARQHSPRHLAELEVHERRQLLQRIRVAAAPGLEQVGQVALLFTSANCKPIVNSANEGSLPCFQNARFGSEFRLWKWKGSGPRNQD